MAMSEPAQKTMKQVPPKNDSQVIFGRNEGYRLYKMVLLKALLPALLPQVLHLVVLGQLVIQFEPDLVSSNCGAATRWVKVIRCEALGDYSGPARTSSGIMVFSVFCICCITASASFVDRFEPLVEDKPWDRNSTWSLSVSVAIVVVAILAAVAVEDGTGSALPWYFYVLGFFVMPMLCVVWNEYWKRIECRHERRAEKLRRLQFETRLGAWSPK